MKVFLDTNIILDEALSRPDFDQDARSVIEWCIRHAEETYVAFHTLTNTYYVLRGQLGNQVARSALRKLLGWVVLAPASQRQFDAALVGDTGDLEDALQCQSALEAGADVIVTRDLRGFRDCQLRTLSPADFLAEVRETEG